MSQYDDLYELEDKPKRKRDEDPTTWADAWKAMGIFVVIYLAIAGITWSIQYLVFGETTEKYFDITLNATDSQQIEILSTFTSSFQNPSLLFLIIYLCLGAIMCVLGLFIIYGLIHVFASKVQGGQGTLRGLIVRANWWTIGVMVVYAVFGMIANTILMVNVVSNFDAIEISQSLSTLNEFNQYVLMQSSWLYGVYFISWLVWCVSIGFVTARNYQINKSNGCVAVLLTNVTLVALYCGCVFAVGFGLASVMLSA